MSTLPLVHCSCLVNLQYPQTGNNPNTHQQVKGHIACLYNGMPLNKKHIVTEADSYFLWDKDGEKDIREGLQRDKRNLGSETYVLYLDDSDGLM